METEAQRELRRQNEEIRQEIEIIRRDEKIDAVAKQILIDGKRMLIRQNEHTLTLTDLHDKSEKNEEKWEWATPYIEEIPPILRSRKFWNRVFWISLPIAITLLIAALTGIKL